MTSWVHGTYLRREGDLDVDCLLLGVVGEIQVESLVEAPERPDGHLAEALRHLWDLFEWR